MMSGAPCWKTSGARPVELGFPLFPRWCDGRTRGRSRYDRRGKGLRKKRCRIENVVRKGTRGWKKIVKAFGNDILLENGEIDRARLGQIVFSDPAKRRVLNRLLAPYISSGIFWEILKLWMKGCKVIILDIPLLFETKMDQWTNPVIVVWVNPETQIERVMSRDGCSEEEARNRINAQLALDWKKSEADIVINNSGSLDDTKEQFQEVLRKVTEPLTWKERLRSRDGLLSIVLCTSVGFLLAQKNLL